MFERFTERARQVVVLPQDEACILRHNYIGTEHILLGLLREEDGLAARALDTLDITVEEVRAQVARIVSPGDEVITGQIPFTPRAKKVLELALREAQSLGQEHIGTEHVLLGLVRENAESRRASCSTSTPTRRRSATRSSACSARPARRVRRNSRRPCHRLQRAAIPGRGSSASPCAPDML
jgi:ATP-dependent Clp protease ATP-binding subunit ClpA